MTATFCKEYGDIEPVRVDGELHCPTCFGAVGAAMAG